MKLTELRKDQADLPRRGTRGPVQAGTLPVLIRQPARHPRVPARPIRTRGLRAPCCWGPSISSGQSPDQGCGTLTIAAAFAATGRQACQHDCCARAPHSPNIGGACPGRKCAADSPAGQQSSHEQALAGRAPATVFARADGGLSDCQDPSPTICVPARIRRSARERFRYPWHAACSFARWRRPRLRGEDGEILGKVRRAGGRVAMAPGAANANFPLNKALVARQCRALSCLRPPQSGRGCHSQ